MRRLFLLLMIIYFNFMISLYPCIRQYAQCIVNVAGWGRSGRKMVTTDKVIRDIHMHSGIFFYTLVKNKDIINVINSRSTFYKTGAFPISA